MSQIHDFNKIANNKAYNTYILESHGELTLIIEDLNGNIAYAEIFGVMITHNTKTKSVKNIVNRVKDYIMELQFNNE